MTAQATFTGEELAVCNGCGTVSDGRCDTCRLADGETEEACDHCEELRFEVNLIPEEVYFSPFDDEPTATGFKYCSTCYEQGEIESNDETFYCDGCYRDIMQDNGYLSQYRIIGDCEMLCLKCIEETLKSEGIAGFEDELDNVLERGKPFGMFFNVGELEGEGWKPVPGFTDHIVSGAYEAALLAELAKEEHEAGRLIIIGYERMSIMGDEGYVTLFSKSTETDYE